MSRAKKRRVDEILVTRGLALTLDEARPLIMAGLVYGESRRFEKAGELIAEDTPLFIRQKETTFVSRGGVKLEGTLKEFQVSPNGKVCLDLGASTGGFTEVLLLHGARKVYSVDVGTAQLHHRLLTDERVVSMEKTHLDNLTPEMFQEVPELAVADLSFISVTRVFPVLMRVMARPFVAILLVKPQFEAAREDVPPGGILENDEVIDSVLIKVQQKASEAGFMVKRICDSPIRGREGNREFFLYLEYSKSSST